MAVRDDLRRSDGASVSENIVRQRPAAEKTPPGMTNPDAQSFYEAAEAVPASYLTGTYTEAVAEAVARPNRDMVAERRETEIQMQREIADGSGSIINATVRDAALRASLMETAAGKTGRRTKRAESTSRRSSSSSISRLKNWTV